MLSGTSLQTDMVDLMGTCKVPPLTKGRLGGVKWRSPLTPPSQGGEPNLPHTQLGSPSLKPGRKTALLVGATADQILRKPGFTGRVLAVGSKAAFIISHQSHILAVSRPDQQPHPRAVLSGMDLRSFTVGMPVSVQGEDVLFGGREAISLGQKPPWRRQPLGPGCGVSLENASRGFDRVLDAALAIHQGENLGLALPDITASSTTVGMGRPPSAGSPLTGAAIELIRRIVPVCRSGRIDLAMPEAEALIGLGPGLTPSGDDFVGGLLFAAYHLKEAFPGELAWDAETIGGLIARSCSMTNAISQALLSDFALGQGYEAIHDLMDGILTGDADFGAETHVIRVTSIGNSSGWDMLTGLLTGMLLVSQGI